MLWYNQQSFFLVFRERNWKPCYCHSVANSCPTLCNPMSLQHTGLLCPSLSPRICSNSCPSSQWCHPTSSSSVVPFSSCLQSFPASGSFPMSQFFASGGQSIRVSASASSPSNEYSGLISFRMDWFHLLAVQQTLKSLLQHHSSKASIWQHSAFVMVQPSHPLSRWCRPTISSSVIPFSSRLVSFPASGSFLLSQFF